MAVHEVFVGHMLAMDDDLDQRPLVGIGSSQLIFFESIEVSPKRFSINQPFSMVQRVILDRSVYNISVNQHLVLSHKGAKVKFGSAFSPFMLWHSVELVEYETPNQALLFNQNVLVHKTKGTYSQLVLTQNVGLQANTRRIINQIFNISSNATFLLDRCDVFGYPIPILTTPEGISFTFGTKTINLRRPDFDNTHSVELTRINRRTRGNDLIIYRDPIWPKTETLEIRFSYLKQSEIRNLFTFLQESLGKDITYVDYHGQTWIGIIITPGTEVIEANRFNQTITLEFMGVLQP